MLVCVTVDREGRGEKARGRDIKTNQLVCFKIVKVGATARATLTRAMHDIQVVSASHPLSFHNMLNTCPFDLLPALCYVPHNSKDFCDQSLDDI